jgi:hypothetical protein
MRTYTLAEASTAVPMLRAAYRQQRGAAAAIAGGGLIVAGSLLPWLTLFAGLHSYRGVVGLNGQLLLAGGVLSIIAGLFLLFRGGRTLIQLTGGLGLAILAVTTWLLVQQHGMYHELMAEHPMTVPGIGPGLYVAAAGALLVALSLLFGRGATRQLAPLET